MPTTEQLAQWARYVLRTSSVLDSRNRRLSSQGRAFIRDVRAWIEAVVELGLSKNVSFEQRVMGCDVNVANANRGCWMRI